MDSRRAVSVAADHVIGRFERESLSTALAATHRAGFGPYARVLDGKRGDVAAQLTRMGLRILEGSPPAAGSLLIVVTAPGRTAKVAELFAQLGAASIALAGRRGVAAAEAAPADAAAPDIRIGDDAGASSAI